MSKIRMKCNGMKQMKLMITKAADSTSISNLDIFGGPSTAWSVRIRNYSGPNAGKCRPE